MPTANPSRKSYAATKSKQLDQIKAMIAAAVQHYLVSAQNSPPALKPLPANVIEVEAHAISATETQIRVKTEDQGTRYFTVKVSENI